VSRGDAGAQHVRVMLANRVADKPGRDGASSELQGGGGMRT
jgi:hypothetical protein